MRALVTGSTGFIGSHLCRALLAAGYRVRAFHRPQSSLALIADLPLEHALGDLTDPLSLQAALQNVDVVFHTASKVDYWRGNNVMYPVTVGGTRHILNAAAQAGVQRLIYTSSVAALGLPQQPGLMDETHFWDGRAPWWRYGHAKHLAEEEVRQAAARGLGAVIVNPAMVLGPGDINRISGELIVQAARRWLPVSLPGSMNVIHIDDAVRGHLLALEGGLSGQRYILGGQNIAYFEMMAQTAAIVGRRPPRWTLPAGLLPHLAAPLDWLSRRVRLPINGDLLRLAGLPMTYSTQKAQRELGFRAEKSVAAIRETYDWYRANGVI